MHKKSIVEKKLIAAILALSVLTGCAQQDAAPASGSDNTSSIKDRFEAGNTGQNDGEEQIDEDIIAETDTEADTEKKQSSTNSQYTPYTRDRKAFENDDTNTYTQTVMVYMVGSDLESSYGNASIDLSEMVAAQPDIENNNVVVFTGGASEWKLDSISGDDSCLLELGKDDFYVKETLDACNMGSADSLSNFVTYCLDEYDTDKYSLILWNHGAGPVMGFGVDENYKDILTLPELQSALESSVGESGKKLEWIGFDACLMNSLEVADILAPYSNYLIASQETEPGWGWNYSFLSKLSEPGMNGAGMGKEIIDAYMDYCDQVFDTYPQYYADVTLSCIDLNAYDDAEKALDEFFADIDGNLDTDLFPAIVRDRQQMRNFGAFSTNYNYSMVDSMSLVNKLSDKGNSEKAEAALTALNDMVVYDQTNLESANGISICYPHATEEIYQETYLKVQDYIDFAPGYSRFLNDMYALENGETISHDWDVSGAEVTVEETEVTIADMTTENGRDISLQLTEEQQKNFASARFMILANAESYGYVDEEDDKRAKDMYFYVYVGKNVQMDENGKLHAYYDNNILYMKDISSDGDGSLSHIPMILIDSDITNSKEKRYTSYAILENLTGDIGNWNTTGVEMQIVRDAAHPNGYIRSAIPLDDDDEDSDIHTPSKQLVDFSDFNLIEVPSTKTRYVTRDENGKLLPFFDWESSEYMMGFDMYIDNGIEFVAQSIPDLENYACVFLIYDAQGNVTSSELIPLAQ